jgi:hypothetical protein
MVQLQAPKMANKVGWVQEGRVGTEGERRNTIIDKVLTIARRRHLSEVTQNLAFLIEPGAPFRSCGILATDVLFAAFQLTRKSIINDISGSIRLTKFRS